MTTLRIEIFPADVAVTVAFYTGVLGFTVDRDDRPALAYVALRRGAVLVGAAQRPAADAVPSQRRPPTGVELVLEVDDVRAERDRIVAAGWPLDDDLSVRPWGLVDVRLLDPDGYYWRLTSAAVTA
ncbi:MAG: VOC family protein [Kineosporiaceae bacterium]